MDEPLRRDRLPQFHHIVCQNGIALLADTMAMFPNDASRLMQMIGRMRDFIIVSS